MIAASKTHCSLPGCDQPVHCRGICHTDYTSAMRLVHSGKTTWEELEQLQIVRPARAVTRIGETRVAVALEEARAAVTQ